jgi:protein-S-isoprenylcysteine O-methyltransferase Ste14
VISLTNNENNELNIRKIIINAIIKFSSGLIIIWSLLFLLAGTIWYWNAWLFLVLILILMITEIVYLARKDPALLQKRLQAKEKVKKQELLVVLSMVLMTIAFIIPGLDYRFHWSQVPLWLVIVGVIFFALGFLMYTVVLRQNRYASRIIEIQKQQQVIDFGLYSVVRHPMYLTIIILDLNVPLILGSYYALIPMFLCCCELIARIKNEEEVLRKGLAGYEAYMKKVKYRLIPYIW